MGSGTLCSQNTGSARDVCPFWRSAYICTLSTPTDGRANNLTTPGVGQHLPAAYNTAPRIADTGRYTPLGSSG